MDKMEIYESCRACPSNALKQITAGRLKGKSDINPMWRIKKLTEMFGACGIGWYYDIDRLWTEATGSNEITAFCNISLYVKIGDEWSKPIRGTGGNMMVANERSGAHVNDECYKMALTDAISVACKALGMAADVYWDTDHTKYPTGKQQASQKIGKATVQTIEGLIAQTNSDKAKLLSYFHLAKLEDMTQEQAQKCVAMLKSKTGGK